MRVLVEKGYTVPDRYVELQEGEEICSECNGLGKVRIRYGPSWDPGGMWRCGYCDGQGKRLRCEKCNQLAIHARYIRPRADPTMNGWCDVCVLKEARASVALDKDAGGRNVTQHDKAAELGATLDQWAAVDPHEEWCAAHQDYPCNCAEEDGG